MFNASGSGGPVAFLQQIASEREGIKEEGGRSSSSAPRLWVLICISAALTSPTDVSGFNNLLEIQLQARQTEYKWRWRRRGS